MPYFLRRRDSDNRGDARPSGCENARYFEFGNFQKALQYMRIELGAAAGIQAANRLCMVEAFAVAAVGDHCVEGIDDGDDARAQRNLICLKAPRISRAVVRLVMMEGEQACLF